MRTTKVHRYVKRSVKGKAFPVRKHKRKLAVPPAWTKVKYYQSGNILASGYDEKGRKQVIQNPRFVERQKRKKFSRVNRLEKQFPGILNKVVRDAEDGNQEAQVVYTMYKTGFRPGTKKDTKADVQAFGAITLQKRHVKVKGPEKVEFSFTGKKGVKVEKEVYDKKLAKFMKERLADTKLFNTSEHKVREYFDKKTNGRFLLKDLRTLKANVLATKIAKKSNGDAKETKKEIAQAVSQELVNTPSVALKSYVEPSIVGEAK